MCLSTTLEDTLHVQVNVDHMVPDLEELPTKKEGEMFNRALYSSISKINSDILQLFLYYVHQKKIHSLFQDAYNEQLILVFKSRTYVNLLLCVIL